ncbi:hypothetical protein SEVIR_4G124002v4 [Setaria viridis]
MQTGPIVEDLLIGVGGRATLQKLLYAVVSTAVQRGRQFQFPKGSAPPAIKHAYRVSVADPPYLINQACQALASRNDGRCKLTHLHGCPSGVRCNAANVHHQLHPCIFEWCCVACVC